TKTPPSPPSPGERYDEPSGSGPQSVLAWGSYEGSAGGRSATIAHGGSNPTAGRRGEAGTRRRTRLALTLDERHQGVDFLRRQVIEGGFANPRTHGLGVDDPEADLGCGKPAPHSVERTARAADPSDRVTRGAPLLSVD